MYEAAFDEVKIDEIVTGCVANQKKRIKKVGAELPYQQNHLSEESQKELEV